ncbi:MAG: hypothetical protein M3Y56_05095 [Armatimonadota bacterium]|nr:hypothetical protein [Armatimonadota bacterium]
MQHPEKFGFRFWLRVFVWFAPLMVIEGYWATYSASVVNGTSFDSIWPPIHIIFTLAVLAGIIAPVHRAVIDRRRGADLLAAGLLWSALAGCLAALASVWPDHPLAEQFVGSGATLLAALFWLPYRTWLRKTRALNRAELLALYGLLAVGSLVQGFGTAHFLIPFVIGPQYFASPSNHWAERLFPLLPKLLFPPNSEAAKEFYVGHRAVVPWAMWAVPLALWTVYVSLVAAVMLGLNGLVRRLWMDGERLTFPQVYLPLEMTRTEDGSILNPFFRNRAMWAGFVMAAALEIVAGVHQYFPSTPAFQFRHVNILQGVQNPPWNSVGSLEICIYPCIIGITYLLTVELSWSTWFFFLVRKLLPILGSQFGWQDTLTQDGTAFPFPDQQSTGAFLAVGLLALWGVWKMHRVVRERWEQVALREWVALLGGIVLLFFWTHLLRMSIVVTAGFLAAMFIACLAYTRVRAEMGLGGITGPMPPQDALIESFGSNTFSNQDLAGLGSLRWSSWDLRFLPGEMPAQLENYKIGEVAGLPPAALFWAMLLAVPFALVVAYLTELPVIYHYGANQMNYLRYTQIPRDSMTLVARFITNPKGPDTTGLSAGGFGFLFTCCLALLRGRYFAFPFHPLGYAIGFSRRTIEWMWFSIFLGWAAKCITLRAGGLSAYRVMLPFFLGLLLGDFTTGGIFGLLGCIFPETAGYSVYP